MSDPDVDEVEAAEEADDLAVKSPERNGANRTNGEKQSRRRRSRSRSKRSSSSRSASSGSSSSRHRSSRRKKKHRRHRSKSHSKSHNRHSKRRRSKTSSESRSRSRSRSRDESHRGSGYGRNTIRPDLDTPPPSRCLGIFGLSLYTDEKTLTRHFSQYGRINKVQIVYDKKSDRSRGFAFLYYDDLDDAVNAKEGANGSEIDGHRIRVDFSFTRKPHTPTPGVYMGRPSYGYRSHSPPYNRRRRQRSFSPRR